MATLIDTPQRWWRIVSVYDGRPNFVAFAVGVDEEDAIGHFRRALLHPELAIIESVTLQHSGTMIEMMQANEDIEG